MYVYINMFIFQYIFISTQTDHQSVLFRVPRCRSKSLATCRINLLDLLVVPLFPSTHQTSDSSDCQKVPDVGIIGQAAHHLAVDRDVVRHRHPARVDMPWTCSLDLWSSNMFWWVSGWCRPPGWTRSCLSTKQGRWQWGSFTAISLDISRSYEVCARVFIDTQHPDWHVLKRGNRSGSQSFRASRVAD